MTQEKDDIITYDYIVIGGGTSGAVAARRLAEGDTNSSVCLLEAGPSHEEVIHGRIPGNWLLGKEKSHDWNYDTVAQKGCNNRIISAPRARFLGGCSAINGTLLIRGTKADYDRIAAMGNPGWSWEDMLPYFKASETFHPAEWHQSDLTVHGTSGPLHTEPYPHAPISEKVIESFIDSGFEYKPDMFVRGDYEGVGHAVRTAYKGIRSTSADFILHYEKTNLTVRTGIYVDRIILEKNNVNNKEKRDYKAVGVEAHYDATGQSIIIKARKEIILSAGAYNSPMVLMYSGIGPAEHLIEMGISYELPHNPVEGEGGIGLYVLLCGPQARGTVRLSSKDPTCKPIIDHAYLENDLDVAVLAEGCRIGHEVLMKGRGTKNIVVGPWPKTISHPKDLADWKKHVRAVASTCFHPCGTCKMAPDTDPMGVVDNQLRVRNVESLRVADVSILPLINNGHTQAPAYAIGEKLAHMVLQDATVAC
ncbi:unnamed protein product [Rotaria sp. Silwood1]|nr:unnamed protein product [Rotaria sp. Silwood1]CAF1153613.1 unnamed protein product [Rotaria sp. Silwood1]CAF3441757.1 unnamed protein product [Rotaria sp. Silwood1]CAF3462825.1 unnamed protein product [Rotaria sp. Silwood1]CAF4770874.1 unnamed protein product [Rotaria sp. Silwood1]